VWPPSLSPHEQRRATAGLARRPSPNRSNIVVGEITGIARKGWEYLWVRYADAKDDTAKAIVKKPVAAYVEKVYEEGSFAGLGIGT